MIIAVTNRLLCQGDFRERLEQIARCRPHSIILREKDLSPAEYEELAAECLPICSRYNVPLVINSHFDVARKLKLPRIHLPLETFLKHRDELGCFQQTGVSVHSREEALRAEGLGAGYLIAGHIFPTDCKQGVPPRGLEFLREVCAAVSIPVFAIGGITQFNVRDVLQAGAAGVCVMSQLMTCENPEDVLAALSIELFERREAMLDLREKLLFAEQQRLAGEPTISLDEAHRRLKEKINEKV
jgi:thiamine-phosphate pyrophosphorylase